MKKGLSFFGSCLFFLSIGLLKVGLVLAADSDDGLFGIFPNFGEIIRLSLHKTLNFPARIWFSILRFFRHSKTYIGWVLLVGIPVIALIILVVYLVKKSRQPALPSYQSMEPIQRAPETPRYTNQPAPPACILYVTQADGSRQDIPMIYDRMMIGRSQDCQIYLNDSKVSAHHAEIYTQEGRYFVRDLGTSNGTFVNGYLIEGIVELFSGYYVQMGDSTIQL